MASGQASRGTFKGVWASWLVMLLSVEEVVRCRKVKKRPQSLGTRSEQWRSLKEVMPSKHLACPSELHRSAEAAKAFLSERMKDSTGLKQSQVSR